MRPRTLTIDDSETGSEPGSWADAIDHSPLLKVSEYAPNDGVQALGVSNLLHATGDTL